MATLTLQPVVQGYINGDDPTTINVGSTLLATGHFSTPQTNRTLLEFDISSLGSDWTVNSATLKLTVQANFLGTSHTLNVYRLKRRWRFGNVNEATWNRYRDDLTQSWGTAGASNTTSDRDATAVGTLSVTSATSGQVSITLTTALIQAWIDGSFENFGLILVASDESSTTLMRWEPSGATNAADRPQLVIDYTPVSHALTDNVLAYHNHDGGVYTDATGNGHTLTANNSPTSVTGKLATATHFVAASDQSLSNNDSALKLGNVDWTWWGWVYLTDNADFYTVVAMDDLLVGSGGFKLFYHKVSVLDYFVAQLYSNDTAGDPVLSDVIGYNGGNPSTGAWHFIAVRHDSVRRWLHLFIDNAAPNSAGSHAEGQSGTSAYGPYPSSPAPSATTAPYRLGRSSTSGSTQPLNGNLDETGFASRWFSNDEIAALKLAIENGNTYPFTAGGGLPARATGLGGGLSTLQGGM